MTPDDLKERARRIPEELLTQGDLSVADELLAPDCQHHAPGSLACGSKGIKGWVTALRRAFPDLCAIVEDEIAEGDMVMQRLALSGTHTGTFVGIPPTGRRASWQTVTIQRLGSDGKFAELWLVADQLDLLGQLSPSRAAADTRHGARDATEPAT